MAVFLLTDSSNSLGVTFGEVQHYFVPFINNWFKAVSYGHFFWSEVKLTNPVTVSKPTCDSSFINSVWTDARAAEPSGFNESEYKPIIVIYPHVWCARPGASDSHFVALSDEKTIASAAPNAVEVYESLQEPGHTVFVTGFPSSPHANALFCPGVVYSRQCLTEALANGFPSECTKADGTPLPATPPVICQYGDPFDAMGSDWPGRLEPSSWFKTPEYVEGDAWPNGVALDKHDLNWTASRKQDVNQTNLPPGTTQTFELSPIEEQTHAHMQFLFVAPTTHMTPWLEIEYRNPPSGTSRWEDGFLTNGSKAWPSVTGGVLLHLDSGLKGESLSALLDTTPGSNGGALCPTGPNYKAFCDFYDAALTPGNTFASGGGDYRVKVVSIGAPGVSSSAATVAISRRFPTSATQVATGNSHTCDLLSSKHVECWGINGSGELGDGTTTSADVPTEVQRISNATQVAAGSEHTCAVLATGHVECWGENEAGQLGNGTHTVSAVPVQVKNISNATQVAAGHDHTCSVLSTGHVECWGNNGSGELGNGTMTSSEVPVPVQNISNATHVAAGYGDTCALLSTGHVECWGGNFQGQLGTGTTTSSDVPVPVQNISNATQVTAHNEHTCALLSTKHIECWGDNVYGQLGDGTSSGPESCEGRACSKTPVPVQKISNATQVGAGWYDTCARLSTGHLECWGRDEEGELGDGTPFNSDVPVPVNNISNATQVAAGGFHTCAPLSTKHVFCWGYGLLGATGLESRLDTHIPLEVP